MKIFYFRPDTVDCTADPHYVNYGDIDEMLQDVLTVLESKLVKSITSVTVYGQDNEMLYESDTYSDFDGSYGDKPPRTKAEGEYAEKHRVEGLYFAGDAKEGHSIPVGLTGYKAVMNMIPSKLPMENLRSIAIGIVWAFSGQHSCSDYITITVDGMMVDYSNQDWYMDNPNYPQHCADLSALIGHHIEANEE